jgi:hypothetical protein
MVNPSQLVASTIPIIVRDANGTVQETDSVTLSPGNHTAFEVNTRLPATAGLAGTIELDPDLTGGFLYVIALRFNGSGGFTAIQPLTRQ